MVLLCILFASGSFAAGGDAARQVRILNFLRQYLGGFSAGEEEGAARHTDMSGSCFGYCPANRGQPSLYDKIVASAAKWFSAGGEEGARRARAATLEAGGAGAPVALIVAAVVVAVALVAVVVAVVLRRRGRADAGPEWDRE
jgi:hypothetical protein